MPKEILPRLPKWQKPLEFDQEGITLPEVIPWLPMQSKFLDALHPLLSDARSPHGIRTMTIKESPFRGLTGMKYPYDACLKIQWPLLKNILQHAINLETFCYDCSLPFPIELLTFLETERPRARVEMLKWHQDCGGPANDPIQLALAKSPSLHTITLGERRCFRSSYKQSFGRIIREAPNLKIIRFSCETKLKTQNSQKPCCTGLWLREPEPWSKLQSTRDDLAGVAVRQAYLDSTTPCRKPVEELKIVRRNMTPDVHFPFDDFWQSFLDLSKLRILDLAKSGLTLDLEQLSYSNPFTGLKKLSFSYYMNVTHKRNVSTLQAAMYTFLDSCSLEALAVFESDRLDIERLLGAQTATLSFLLIEWCPTATDLHYLRDQCRLLEFLGVNTTRALNEDLSVLVTFENLRCLRLQVEGNSTLSQFDCSRILADNFIGEEDWQEDMLAYYSHINSSNWILVTLWNFIASNWCGKQLPKVAIRGRYGPTTPHGYLPPGFYIHTGKCEAYWVIEPKGPGSRDADFYCGFDFVGFENYKVASFPDAKLDYPKIAMPYMERSDNY